jgi:hypothetical protein
MQDHNINDALTEVFGTIHTEIDSLGRRRLVLGVIGQLLRSIIDDGNEVSATYMALYIPSGTYLTLKAVGTLYKKGNPDADVIIEYYYNDAPLRNEIILFIDNQKVLGVGGESLKVMKSSQREEIVL